MPRPNAEAPSKPRQAHPDRDSWARTVSLVVIATVVVLAASTQMTGLIIPLILALVLAIALHPVASWIERRGLGRGASSIACTAIVTLILLTAAGLVAAQAGRVVRDSDRYFDQFSRLASKVTGPLRGSPFFGAVTEPEVMTGSEGGEQEGGSAPGREPGGEAEAGAGAGADSSQRTEASDSDGSSTPGITSQEYWAEKVRENAGSIGQWVMRSVGGVLGVLGQVVVFLFLILYILYSRGEWSARIVRAGNALGMELKDEDLERMGRTISSWVGCVLMVATGYAVTIALVSWAVGLPQWALWGLMTGLLVLVPYFGAVIAGGMLVFVAAITSQALWPPLVMLGVYVLLQTLESYIILPMLYGEAISIDPLAVLVGVLFFGFLWGPLGFVTALPMMVLIRGFVEVTPGSAPIGALFGGNGRES
ncbi:AI-2E family transporter [Tautonia plasticadhaerens]|uniref:AI-2 transport protein TqsA n=1 Tax=Tautonia plasticadhaerens TaxID=2527974 RepID=A0A518H061_9BACT|nr:AI-2E family transporter [Tautonia plasticadhaerens]QDV34223.1 AI-2 transport protein TqsA [Tautonia plasticadhaerens]